MATQLEDVFIASWVLSTGKELHQGYKVVFILAGFAHGIIKNSVPNGWILSPRIGVPPSLHRGR
jgi:hypothetical protein